MSLAAVGITLVLAAPAQGASGYWERAWGANVGGSGIDICTKAASCSTGGDTGLGGSLHLCEGAATDADGNVYVSDSANHRIQKFDSSGNFLRAWCEDVVSGGGNGFEICTAAASCKAGQSGGLGGELQSPSGV